MATSWAFGYRASNGATVMFAESGGTNTGGDLTLTFRPSATFQVGDTVKAKVTNTVAGGAPSSVSDSSGRAWTYTVSADQKTVTLTGGTATAVVSSATLTVTIGGSTVTGTYKVDAATPPPPPPPSGSPRVRLHGIGGRSRARTEAEMPLVTAGPGGFTVLEVDWKAIQPQSGALNTAKVNALKADLDWADDNDLNVFLRTFAGIYSPDWVKALSGSITPWYSNDNADREWRELPGGVPIWTHPKFAQAYRDWQQRMADAIGDHPRLAVVSMALCMTQYAEPCIKQYAYAPNANAAARAGLSTDADIEAFKTGFDIHAAVWSPKGVATACSYNTHQGLSAAGTLSSSMPRTLDLMDEQLARLGKFTVWENNSLLDPDTEYVEMYEKMEAGRAGPKKVCLHFQTETAAKHVKHWTASAKTSPARTFEKAIRLGAASVEFPTGGMGRMEKGGTVYWEAISISDAADFNRRLKANIVPA